MSAEATRPDVGLTCLACRAPLEPEAAEGLCAACLLGRALAFSDAAGDSPGTDPDLVTAADLEGRTLGDYESVTSVYGKLWEAGGMAYPDLLEKLCQIGIDRHAAAAEKKF